MDGSQGTAHKSKPKAHKTSPHWLTRMAPMRATVAPPIKVATMAPA